MVDDTITLTIIVTSLLQQFVTLSGFLMELLINLYGDDNVARARVHRRNPEKSPQN